MSRGKGNRPQAGSAGSVMWVGILEKFLEWYRANVFGAIHSANQTEKESLTYDLASENQVPPRWLRGEGYIDFEATATSRSAASSSRPARVGDTAADRQKFSKMLLVLGSIGTDLCN